MLPGGHSNRANKKRESQGNSFLSSWHTPQRLFSNSPGSVRKSHLWEPSLAFASISNLVNTECKHSEVSRNMKPGCVPSWCVLVSFHPQKAELHVSVLLLGLCSQVPPLLPGLCNTTACRGSVGISLSSLHRQLLRKCSSWRTHNSLSLF